MPRIDRPADQWLGRTVAGRYRIVSLLGEGGIGRVYSAEQAMGATKRRLALKMLLPQHANNPEVVSRFLRECEVASLVEHPNVVRIYDFGEAERGVLFIAMELVPGRSLATILEEEGALPVERALHILAQVCRGVAAAHDRAIVHRDLKPDNLMIVSHPGEPDFVKVLDFGIAKAVVPGARDITFLGEVLGSPPYMSPEQHLGQEVDARTDVYALGVLAYETLTGVLPLRGNDMIEWAAQHIGGDPMPFESTPAGCRVPEPIRRAIFRALAKDRGDRQRDPRSFLAELFATLTAVAPTAAAAPPCRVSAPTLLATVFTPPVAMAFATPRVAAPQRRPAARKGGLRRWFSRTVVAAAMVTGGVMAFELRDARDASEVIERLETAVDAVHLAILDQT